MSGAKMGRKCNTAATKRPISNRGMCTWNKNTTIYSLRSYWRHWPQKHRCTRRPKHWQWSASWLSSLFLDLIWETKQSEISIQLQVVVVKNVLSPTRSRRRPNLKPWDKFRAVLRFISSLRSCALSFTAMLSCLFVFGWCRKLHEKVQHGIHTSLPRGKPNEYHTYKI